MCLSNTCDTGMTLNISNDRFLRITAEYMVHSIGRGAFQVVFVREPHDQKEICAGHMHFY